MKALILTGRLVQDEELIVPTAMLQAAGYEINIAAEDVGEFTGFRGCKFKADMAFGDLIPSLYDLLILPGGVKCMEHMRLHPVPKKLIREFHESGKVIGCICSGAFLLISAGLCKGRKISTYPAWQIDVENAGGTFVNDVVVDDRIVTAPHYKDAGRWMAAVLKQAGNACLCGGIGGGNDPDCPVHGLPSVEPTEHLMHQHFSVPWDVGR